MNLGQLFALKNGQKGLITPRKFDFKVYASICIHRSMDADSVDSIFKLMCCPNPKVICGMRKGDALIDRSRSIEASRFLDTDAEVMLFLDDDIIYNPEDVVKICREALERKSIVGATYVTKSQVQPVITAKPFKGQKIVFGKNSELVEVRSVATGCMAFHRSVMEKVKDTVPFCHPDSLKMWPVFQPFPKEIDGKWIYLSEDWAYCERARDLGFKVWLDPSIRLKHAGRYVYELEDMVKPEKQNFDIINYTDPN